MVKLTDNEIAMFETLAGTRQAQILREYFEKLISDTVDIRNMPVEDVQSEIKARKMFVQMVEDGIISKLKANKLDNKENKNEFE